MPDILRIKRRSSGNPGAPTSLAYAEIAFNEVDNTLYYGRGNNAGQAVTIIPIAGPGFTPATPAGASGQVQYNDAGLFGGDASFTFNKATGALTLANSLVLNKPTTGMNIGFEGQNSGVRRWLCIVGDATGEAGGNSGSNFIIARYSDGGGFLGYVLTIARDTGLATVAGDPTAALGIATKQYVDSHAGGGGSPPGGSNTQVQFNDSGAFGGDAGLTYDKGTDTLSAGDIKVAQWNGVQAPVQLKLQSTGGTYGQSILRITNETGVNGAMFETVPTSGAELVDFVFKVGSITQQNIRLEARPAYLMSGNSWEFQIGSAAPPPLAIGNSSAKFNVTLNTGNLGVNGSIYLTGSTNAVYFYDRTNASYYWGWYASGGTIARLYSNYSGDLLTINADGTLTISIGGQITFKYDPNVNNGTFTLGAKPPHGQLLQFCARSDITGSARFFGAANYSFDAAISVPANPVNPLELATKQYVDSKPSGSGDVVGPAGATDNAVARFDTTTGKLLQNGLLILADDGMLTIGGNGKLQFEDANGWITRTAASGAMQFAPASNTAQMQLTAAQLQLFCPILSGLTASQAQSTFSIRATGRGPNAGAAHLFTITGSHGSTTGAGTAGGDVTISAGSANGTGNNKGGDLILQGGVNTGTGIAGQVLLQADPISALGAATKQYVDNKPSGAAISVGDAPPGSPTDNMLWFESDTGILWLRYNDSTSTQWIAVSVPPGPTMGFLPLTGGSLSGDLTITTASWPSLIIRKTVSGVGSHIVGYLNTTARWDLHLGDNAAESSGNQGSDFRIDRYSDAGAYIGTPLTITRSTGDVFTGGFLGVNGATGSVPVAMSVRRTPGATTYYWDQAAVEFQDARNMATGVGGLIVFSGKYDTAGNYAVMGGIGAYKNNATSGDPNANLNIWSRVGNINFFAGNIGFTGQAVSIWTDARVRFYSSIIWHDSGYPLINGNANDLAFQLGNSNPGYFYWYNREGSLIGKCYGYDGKWYNIQASWTAISDRSTKENIQPYPRGLKEIMELNPVFFTYKSGLDAVDGNLRFGLIAQEVQPHLPELVGETDIELAGEQQMVATLEPSNLIYACINAIKELSAEIESLKQQIGAI